MILSLSGLEHSLFLQTLCDSHVHLSKTKTTSPWKTTTIYMKCRGVMIMAYDSVYLCKAIVTLGSNYQQKQQQFEKQNP